MPPEVLVSNRAANVSDIYHVGALLYRCLNGEENWQHQLSSIPNDVSLIKAIKAGKFPDRNHFIPHIPKRLRTIIRKAMSVVPTDRYLSATAFAADLGKVLVPHDWQVELDPSGAIEWTCEQNGSASLLVELDQTSGNWHTRVFTQKAGKPRARGRDKFWGTFATRGAALSSLKQVFEAL